LLAGLVSATAVGSGALPPWLSFAIGAYTIIEAVFFVYGKFRCAVAAAATPAARQPARCCCLLKSPPAPHPVEAAPNAHYHAPRSCTPAPPPLPFPQVPRTQPAE
jgi:hypothetical protein